MHAAAHSCACADLYTRQAESQGIKQACLAPRCASIQVMHLACIVAAASTASTQGGASV